MTRKGYRHRLTIGCLEKNCLSCERASIIIKYTLQGKEYRGSALRSHHEKAQGSCALSRRSLAGGAILDYISFPVCIFLAGII